MIMNFLGSVGDLVSCGNQQAGKLQFRVDLFNGNRDGVKAVRPEFGAWKFPSGGLLWACGRDPNPWRTAA